MYVYYLERLLQNISMINDENYIFNLLKFIKKKKYSTLRVFVIQIMNLN